MFLWESALGGMKRLPGWADYGKLRIEMKGTVTAGRPRRWEERQWGQEKQWGEVRKKKQRQSLSASLLTNLKKIKYKVSYLNEALNFCPNVEKGKNLNSLKYEC